MKFKTKDLDRAEVVLDIRHLTVRLAGAESGQEPVLNDVSLRVRAGETACLVGESGSGKSVTSLTVMGLLPKGALEVAGGEIELDGEQLLSMTPSQMRRLRGQRIAMIFQEPMTALNPVMRVGDQIAEVLKTHASLAGQACRARVLDVMEQVYLPDVERIYASYPHQLSGGQRQRIMIAMALVMEPRLLIADEPTTALDVTTQAQILSLIAELQERHGTAVLFITHDMGVVAEVAHTVHVMKNGRVVEHAPVEQLLRRPVQEYTHRLLTSVPSLLPRPERPVGATEPVLEVRNLNKTYGRGGWLFRRPGTAAAREVNFSVMPGRTLGIVGESGSGKSTVARSIMRLVDPSSGEIHVAGKEIARLSRRALRPHRRHFQVVFQDPFRSLNPRWSVGRSLTEGLVNFGTPQREARERALEMMELVGLPTDSLQRYPHQFSGGQRQRIAIARAVMMRPDVLVADEAVSALDVSVQAQVLALLDEIQLKLGIAILFITHDLRVAAQICDDVIVMQHGVIVEHGSAREVLTSPRHSYTRSLIDAAPGREWDFANFCELQVAS
ncbi:ABC transporter ATP-binding protein [Billgrantia desiderata]|uniref:ABC transporter ATP-binding protein n=1 Tax=Billgrantia desiderata TaxID=52021 RepID=UPI00089EA092|nr:ABC transporter ATP-binding protein [Halomonas desiderata]SEF47645.1 peptide/nickel transport system ATP-binding protein [Halomonas desiderata]